MEKRKELAIAASPADVLGTIPPMKTAIVGALIRAARVQVRMLPLAVALVLAIIPAHATTVIAQDFNSLVSGADYVVRAVVKSVTSEYRTTPRGQAIFTKVELQVVETITGTPPQPLVLQVLGGTVDGVTMRVEGVPQFHVGDEDILFVQNNGTQFFPLVGIMNGKYPVKHDAVTGAAYVARSNGVPLYDVQDIKQDMTPALVARMQHPGQQPLSLETFVGKIRAAHNNQVAPKPPSLAN